MSIRKKTLFIVGIIVLVLISFLNTLTYLVVNGRFEKLELKTVQAHVQRAQNEIKATLAFLESTAADWGQWDDTYRFVEDTNQAYVDTNLGDSTFSNLRLNFMLFFNTRRQLVHARFSDLTGDGPAIDQNAILETVDRQSEALLLHTRGKNRISGILMVGSTPYLVASHSIVPSNLTGEMRGVLILGRMLDAGEIRHMGNTAKIAFSLHEMDAKDLKADKTNVTAGLGHAGAIHTAPVSGNTIAVYGMIFDLSDRPALILEITEARDIYQYGLATWRQNALAMSLSGLLFIALLIAVLDRTVLTRLADLARKVNQVAVGSGEQEVRLDIHSMDEIGQLADRINIMLHARHAYHLRQMESERRYRSLLQDNERYLRELLDSICSGVMVVDQESRRVVDVNAAAAALFQRTREDMIDHVCHGFVCRNEKGNCPVLDLNQTIDLSQRKLLRADGSTLPILKTVTKTERNGRRYLIESFIDISALKKAEADLRKSEARYRRFFEEDITGNSLTTADGRIVDCNAALARIFGYDSADEIKGHSIQEFYPAETDRTKLIKQLRKKKKLESVEVKLVHRNGHLLYCIANLIGQFGPDGELNEVNTYLFDDTKRVQLENDLRQAHKLEAIGTLAGGIAHDFNNILSGIMGYTEIALYELPESSSPAKRLRKVLQATQRARDLIEQILTFSRQSESDPRPIEIYPLVREVLKLMRAILPATIDIQAPCQGAFTVIADPVQVHQVIMNLCTNAGYAMKQTGGTLTVSLGQESLTESFTGRYPKVKPGEFVRISVEDTGEGIPAAVMDRIFDPFFTTKKKSAGTGLGLSVVHGIVSKLGGAITAASASGGSRFDVYLPSAMKEIEALVPQPESVPLGTETIVLIDDEEFQVDVVKQMLGKLGYQVTGFTDSLQALDYLMHDGIGVDLVITDMTMPRLTGLALTEKLLKAMPDLPVIICTGYSEEITPEKAFAMGIRGFMPKPILLQELARKVRDVLESSAAP